MHFPPEKNLGLRTFLTPCASNINIFPKIRNDRDDWMILWKPESAGASLLSCWVRPDSFLLALESTLMPHNIPLIGMVGNLYVHFHQSRMSQHTIADTQAAQCLKIDPCEKDHFKPKGVI